MSTYQNREWTPEDRRVIDALADMLRKVRVAPETALAIERRFFQIELGFLRVKLRCKLLAFSIRRITSRWMKWKHNRCQ